MPKPIKKKLRKIRDRIIHCANDLRTEIKEEGLPNDQRGLLDDAHTLLITATNKLTEATNFMLKEK